MGVGSETKGLAMPASLMLVRGAGQRWLCTSETDLVGLRVGESGQRTLSIKRLRKRTSLYHTQAVQ